MGYVQHRGPNFFDSSGSDEAYKGFISSLRGLGSDADAERKFQIQEARQRAAEDFMRRQSASAEDRARAADERDRRKYELEMSDRNAKQTGALYQTAIQRPSLASAQAAAGRYVDPKTGEQRSIDFDPGGQQTTTEFDPMQLQEPGAQPPAPQPYAGAAGMLRLRPPGAPAPPPLEQPPAAGGGEEDAMGGQPSGMQPRPPQAPVEPPPVGEANGAAPIQAPTYGGLASALKLGPQAPQARTTTTMRPPSIGLPGGGRVTVDLEEERKAKLQDAADTADRLVSQASQEPDPRRRDELMAESRRVRASISGASAAGLRSADLQESGQNFKAGENAKYNTTAEQKFKIGMRPRASGGGAGGEPGLKEQSFELRDFNSWVQANKIKDLPPLARRIQRALTDVGRTGPDAALAHRAGALDIAGIARGGVPQDSEQKFMYDAIQHSIAGWPSYLKNKLANGDISDELQRNLEEAGKSALQALQSSSESAGAAARRGLHTADNPRQRDRVASVLLSSGMDEKKVDEILTGKPAAAAGPQIPEGTRKTLSTGKKVVFKGGQWQPDR